MTYLRIGIAPGAALTQRQARGANQRHDQLQRGLIVAELQLQPALDGYWLCGHAHAMPMVRVGVGVRVRVRVWKRMRMRMRKRVRVRVRWR